MILTIVNEIGDILLNIFNLLNNSFLGGLLVGILLARYGFYLYKKQKKVDLQCDDRKNIVNLASILFTHMELSLKDYNNQFNIYNGKNILLEAILKKINGLFNNYNDKILSKFNTHIERIEESSIDLIAQLKIQGNYEKEIKILLEEMPSLKTYLLSAPIFKDSNKKEIQEFKEKIEKVSLKIKQTLQNLIKSNS